MKNSSNSKVTRHFFILISQGQINDEHPELSSLTLSILGPFPAIDGVSADIQEVGSIRLKPGNKIAVKPGDKITWIIVDTSIISSILILHKDKGKNVFESGPAPVPGSTTWSGIIDKKIRGKKEEYYSICWSQGGMTYCFDPKITVNP